MRTSRFAPSACLATFFGIAIGVPLRAQTAEPPPNASAGEPVQMEQFNVTGTADQGYRVGLVPQVEPWDGGRLQDVPYSINVMSSEMIDNRIISSTDQLFEENPLIQIYLNQSRGYGSFIYIRGIRMGGTVSGFTELNGLRMYGDLIVPVEDKQEVQVFTGLTGYLYGPGNAGGLVNYVTKMPTATPIADFTMGDYGGGEAFAHLDTGGPIDKAGKFGYRVNVVGADGDTAIDYNHVEKVLASLSADYRLSDSLLFQVDYSHQHYNETGTQADFGSFNGTTILHFDPGILDPTKLYSQPWTYNTNDLDVAGAMLKAQLAPFLDLRTAYQFAEIQDENIYTGNNLTSEVDGVDTFSMTALRNAPKQHLNNGGYAFFDAKFDLGPIANKLTFGYYSDAYILNVHRDETQLFTIGSYVLAANPTYVPEPIFTNGVLPRYTSQDTRNQNWVVGDELKFGRLWSGLVGINRSEIDTTNYATTGAVSSVYDKTVATPSGSIVFKPISWLSFYASYIQSLVNSGTAAATYTGAPVTNAGQAVAPTLSHQTEVGAKATVGQLFLTAALFQINMANTYYATANNGASFTFTTDGVERNRGLELTATGKITSDLTIYGGINFMNSIITQTNTPYLLNQPPYGAAQQMGKVYLEYAVPTTHLVLDGGLNYVGRQIGNEFSTPSTDAAAREWLPSYTTFDLGARYALPVGRTVVVLRVDATNVANRSYWQMPEVTGGPRSIAFSGTLHW